jgi:hypothetical protein
MYLFKGNRWDVGNVRETFLANQLAYENQIQFPETGDFLVNGQYLIEVGGKNKTRKQLKAGSVDDNSNGYIAADDIEYGFGKKIPLWLFGFLY